MSRSNVYKQKKINGMRRNFHVILSVCERRESE